MYRCKDCGEYFDEPMLVADDPSPRGISMLEGYCYERHCPMCGSSDIEEAYTCMVCGEYTPAGQVLCDGCRDDLEIGLKELAAEMNITMDDLQSGIEEVYCGG